ncbi:hypothetical protein ACP4OV_015051 [Aristida adscensionis]
MEEYEAARAELIEELSRGLSLDKLRAKLTKAPESSRTDFPISQSTVAEVPEGLPEELVQVQVEFEEARKQLQAELDKGSSIDQLRKKILKGNIEILDLFTKSLLEQDNCEVLSRKLFKFGDNEILAIATKARKTKVHLARNYMEPLILHWSLSEKAGEWKAPPSNNLPSGSKLLDRACETLFSKSELDGLHCQVVEVELGDSGYKGLPFVLHTHVTKNTKDTGDAGKGTSKALLERIADLEEDAQRSLMHRFNIAADLVNQARDAGLLGIIGLFVWIRFTATRQLIWNKNYNVKPREISKAQDRFTDDLENMYRTYPQYREILRMIMSAVGRGGEGDVGQRIRDEILVIQRNNDCKGGMMEEWHQKLHNNTSPDDVVICQASSSAVHSGADLESAIAACMGYKDEGEGFMVGVQINPVKGLPSGFAELLEFVLDHVDDKSAEPLLEGLLEAQVELRPLLLDSPERMKDLIFLDIALDSTFRTAIEDHMSSSTMQHQSLVHENLALSTDDNEDILYCLKNPRKN